MRFNGWVELAVVEFIPIDIFEPGVVFDVLGVTTEIAETLCWVDYAELGDEVFGVGGHARRVFDFAFDDSVAKVSIEGVSSKLVYRAYCS